MMALAVHGGAWNIPDDVVEAHLSGCEKALMGGWSTLESGKTALDGVEVAVRILEEDPAFDAGIGSFLNDEGEVELDALIMDGATCEFGSVAAVKCVIHPISLARAVMEETDHAFLVGNGARAFAERVGFPLCEPRELIVKREALRFRDLTKNGRLGKMAFGHDTVGAIALDAYGDIAAATSTGGSPGKMAGRVGDTPLIGCGAYADKDGAAIATGWGESLMKIVASKTACDLLKDQKAQIAAESLIEILEGVCGLGGILVMNSKGEVGISHNTPRMAHGFVKEGGEPVIGI